MQAEIMCYIYNVGQ